MNNIKFVVVASVLAGPLLPASAGLEGWQYQRKITIQENSGETLIDYQVLVDDFDHETTSAFMEKHGFFDDEMVMACESFGGKPGYLVELVNTKLGGGDVTKKADKMLEEEISRLIFMLARNKETKSDIIDMLTIFVSVEEVKYSDSMDIDLLSFLVKQNLLFLDPVNRTIKPQSRMNMIAIREAIADA